MNFRSTTRALILVSVALSVAGCGIIAQKKRQEEFAATKANADRMLADCDLKYKKIKGQMLDRMRCRGEAFALYKPQLPFPDLLDQEITSLMVVAERVDAGEMSYAEGEQAASEIHSRMVAEEQRRMLASRSVSAQESAASAAWRASAPVTCTRSGNSTTCF